MTFDKTKLETKYANVVRDLEGSHLKGRIHYSILDSNGYPLARVVLKQEGGMNVEIQALGSTPEYYSTSIPFESNADFQNELQGYGIELVDITGQDEGAQARRDSAIYWMNQFINHPVSEDSVFGEAVKVVIEFNSATCTLINGLLKVDLSRAKRLLAKMEEIGLVSPAERNGKRLVSVAYLNWSSSAGS